MLALLGAEHRWGLGTEWSRRLGLGYNSQWICKNRGNTICCIHPWGMGRDFKSQKIALKAPHSLWKKPRGQKTTPKLFFKLNFLISIIILGSNSCLLVSWSWLCWDLPCFWCSPGVFPCSLGHEKSAVLLVGILNCSARWNCSLWMALGLPLRCALLTAVLVSATQWRI